MAANHISAEDLDVLALGALDATERQAAERHVRECAECGRELAAAQARMAMLSLAVPQQKPPSRVKEQLMARIAATPQSAPGAAIVPSAVRVPEIRQPKRPLWTLAWGALAFGLAAAAILLRVSNERLGREMQTLQQSTAQLQQEQKANQALVQLFTAHDSLDVSLAPVAGQPSGPARVEYNAQRGLLFYAGTLPAPGAGRSYQLWLVPVSGNPISAGVFQPDSAGRALIVLPQLPAGIAAKAFAVTIEPAGGAPQPTGPKVQLGAVT